VALLCGAEFLLRLLVYRYREPYLREPDSARSFPSGNLIIDRAYRPSDPLQPDSSCTEPPRRSFEFVMDVVQLEIPAVNFVHKYEGLFSFK
jgi:hypothetical protein